MIFGVGERGSRWRRRIVKRRVGMAEMETASSDKNTEDSTEEGRGRDDGEERKRRLVMFKSG